MELHPHGQLVQVIWRWDGSLGTPAWLAQQVSLTVES